MGNDFRIIMTGHGQGKVFKDGQELEGVTAIKFSTVAGGVNVVELAFTAKEIEIEGMAEEANG